jgi:hypothetical protein
VKSGSKELILHAFQGRANKIPVYYWLADPELEAKVGDIVGVRCWFDEFEIFLREGGPFKRVGEAYRSWSERLDLDSYPWPNPENLLEEVNRKIEKTIRVNKDKSFQVEIIGPTEYSEYSCAPGQTQEARRLDQVFHRFDFAVLSQLNFDKAIKIHKRFFNLILEGVKRAAENKVIDSIRIADDFCHYGGSVYNPEFTQVLLERQAQLATEIKRKGKYAVLHSDGNITPYIDFLSKHFDGLHPLDVCQKSTVSAALAWSLKLGEIRKCLPETTFFTGIPIELLCNKHVSNKELVRVLKSVISNVGTNYLVLTTTHRPYPGWTYYNFEDKVLAINRFVERYPINID